MFLSILQYDYTSMMMMMMMCCGFWFWFIFMCVAATAILFARQQRSRMYEHTGIDVCTADFGISENVEEMRVHTKPGVDMDDVRMLI